MCEFFLYQMLLAMRLSPPVCGGPAANRKARSGKPDRPVLPLRMGAPYTHPAPDARKLGRASKTPPDRALPPTAHIPHPDRHPNRGPSIWTRVKPCTDLNAPSQKPHPARPAQRPPARPPPKPARIRTKMNPRANLNAPTPRQGPHPPAPNPAAGSSRQRSHEYLSQGEPPVNLNAHPKAHRPQLRPRKARPTASSTALIPTAMASGVNLDASRPKNHRPGRLAPRMTAPIPQSANTPCAQPASG